MLEVVTVIKLFTFFEDLVLNVVTILEGTPSVADRGLRRKAPQY